MLELCLLIFGYILPLIASYLLVRKRHQEGDEASLVDVFFIICPFFNIGVMIIEFYDQNQDRVQNFFGKINTEKIVEIIFGKK